MSKKYKIGYYHSIIDDFDKQVFIQLKKHSDECEEFVIGIPNNEIYARIYGDNKSYSCDEIKELLMDFRWVSEVIILDATLLNLQNVYKSVNYDVCFYGSEYGNQFESDKIFMESHNIDFLPILPSQYLNNNFEDALKIALLNVTKEQKIVLFGTGSYFDIYMKNYGSKYKPAYAIDNAKEKWESQKNGILIKNPDELLKENPKDVLVIICSKNYLGMLNQLKQFGSFNYRTMIYRNKIALLDEFSISLSDEEKYLFKAHDILIKLLDEFNRVCNKYGLHYYVICGSLIGVVRHHDIIPWDDDIDIAMTRNDFEKLKKIASSEWNSDEFKFLNYNELGNGAFLDFMPRLFYLKEKLPTKVYDKVYGKATADVKDRMFIDIYVLDNASDNKTKHMFFMYMLKAVYGLCMGHRGNIDYSEYSRLSEPFLFSMHCAHFLGKLIPLKILLSCYEKLSKYANKLNCENYYMNSCAITCIERRFKQIYFGDGKKMKMRDIEVEVPQDYDGLLNAMEYKNYMQFPPISIRKPSHYFNSDILIW